MRERESFMRAICLNPLDDTPRLIFADWLDENGEPDYARFIRAQIRLAHAGILLDYRESKPRDFSHYCPRCQLLCGDEKCDSKYELIELSESQIADLLVSFVFIRETSLDESLITDSRVREYSEFRVERGFVSELTIHGLQGLFHFDRRRGKAVSVRLSKDWRGFFKDNPICKVRCLSSRTFERMPLEKVRFSSSTWVPPAVIKETAVVGGDRCELEERILFGDSHPSWFGVTFLDEKFAFECFQIAVANVARRLDFNYRPRKKVASA